ncbi:30S ribosomal protein S12 methylthiotransferase RimO [bacterium]|nr:MAG: 30S ribosomal protein S12 methylthiotransferase RimO [bacterium]
MTLPKIGIVSLGCPRNLVDSQAILDRLCRKGYAIADIDEADIAVVNTCSFIDEAKKESVDAILELIDLKKGGRLKRVVVAGCLPQRYKEELLPHLKEVDAFVGRIELEDKTAPLRSYSLTPQHFAYLKIAEGCSHACSFCVIPKIKGRLKSRSREAILREAGRLDRERKSEINLIGQDISHYGLDIYKKLELARLLRAIASSLKHARWLRLLYLHPENVTDDLLGVVSSEPRICKYVDLPLQHINRRVLKAMRRRFDTAKIMRLLSRMRKRIPGVAIRTSLIVGFPGETEREFKELVAFVEEQRFERLGVFKYSREEGTAAFGYPEQVPQKIKEERYDIIMRLQAQISAQLNKGFLGRELEVLIDEQNSDGTYLGRLSIDAPEIDGSVYVKAQKPIKPGEFVKARITDAYEYDLAGSAL